MLRCVSFFASASPVVSPWFIPRWIFMWNQGNDVYSRFKSAFLQLTLGKPPAGGEATPTKNYGTNYGVKKGRRAVNRNFHLVLTLAHHYNLFFMLCSTPGEERKQKYKEQKEKLWQK